ncbi:putative bifunctional diguanylate cyclase/phosphodiesterase [Sphingomonas radiodurans]|uniref:putative bifunctional diguanylate cyclase/phosphodiesterase n=1 Tax=Sphingomonas radiodurans TaxID=2890321 RepID=UPI001E2EAB36|nr:EAL domain-containing protein [Sphingomonas radiodurans]WBH15975.1 EAL domain-containing protein [Sphingomonas radiodurans]
MVELTPRAAGAPAAELGSTTRIVTAAAIALFVLLGGSALDILLRRWLGANDPLDPMLVIALLLNVALILIGWRRHNALVQALGNHEAASERLRLLSSCDPLTGFLNRRSLVEEGSAMLHEATRRGRAVALVMLGLDRFKTVNDLYGHAAGDALLARVGREIAEILPPVALVARLGGDEFACAFVFDPREPAMVQRIAEQLVSRLAQAIEIDGQQIHISASVGIARSDVERGSIDALMRAADIAMYAAKEAGRNRSAWFDPAMARALHARNELENGLRGAIPAGHIVPYFEQQIDLASGRLYGFEVLARWEHPVHGTIGPDRFIPIAEQSGLIADLSMAVMRQAFLAARDWDPALTISVNISPWQFRDAWLPQKIIKLLLETGFPAHRLEIEITESALFDNLSLAQSIVGSLKNQGIRIALDDFGTGYSSLAHLRALPFDRIKIDRSFVQAIADHADSAAIVSAIASLGASLNLPVTAEGIEDAEIEARLRALGCARGQGYHYGRPMSGANTRRMLAERRMLATGAGAVDLGQRRAG